MSDSTHHNPSNSRGPVPDHRTRLSELGGVLEGDHIRWRSTASAAPFNDLTVKAVDLTLDQSRTCFQVTLVVLGALWGLMIAKKDETQIALKDSPEPTMFIVASALLLLSIWWHRFYFDDVAAAFALTGTTCAREPRCIPDVF